MRRRLRPRWLLVYLLLLGASQVVRAVASRDGRPRANQRVYSVRTVAGARLSEPPVRLAVFDSGPPARAAAPVVVLLHGSPGDHREVLPLSRLLAAEYRVLAPDLPGFGGSSSRVPDYSIRAHARYVLQLLDSLRIPRAHLIGFSMGGGVALHVADFAPDRVASLTMLSAIGVQEYELLGDYHLNHLVHGLQLAGLWLLRNAVPHFGAFDGGMLTGQYARNFYDTDQRPLRGILGGYPGPMLILQGRADPLVPAAIATEHARLVPQSELVLLPGDHFLTFQQPRVVAQPILRFLTRAEGGRAIGRSSADTARRRAAAQPFDPRSIPAATGIALVVLLLLLAAATLVSEDFTCIATGLLVSRGTIGFIPGTLACLVGIVVGDLLLYGAGRLLGRPLLSALSGDAARGPGFLAALRAPLARASGWLSRRGPVVVLSSRFVPGSRLPTFLAAGALHTEFLPFAGYFLLAAALWTPLLVGIAVVSGEAGPMLFEGWQHWSLPLLLLAGLVLLLVVKLIVPLGSWRGRRLLLSRWRRLVRWEFWPRWAFYPPVVAYILWLGLKYRCLTLFTAANPAIEGGGFAGESKWRILQRLAAPAEQRPATTCIPGTAAVLAKVRLTESFIAANRLDWPIVLKPDIGERGDGVVLVHTIAELRGYFERAGGDVLAQEYVPGHEFGVFYYRLPGEGRGRVFSITLKRLPTVTGDGRSTLERLILSDDRAVCQARLFLKRHARALWEVPPEGTVVRLAELGTHCRGAAFFDGAALITPALEAEFDRLSKGFDGFWFGRYDVRAESPEALQAGRFRVIELNGATSEATSIYDPAHRLSEAYATLREQWRIAFEIGARNRQAGARPARLRELWHLLWRHRVARRGHVGDEYLT